MRKQKLRQHREGATAVEFAIVAFPFFLMMFAILELGLVFITDSVLENATMETGRLIRTGQAEQNNIDAAEFKQELCSRMSIFESDCADRAWIDVTEQVQFAGADLPDPLENGVEFDENELGYDIGDPGSLMVVRVFYEHPLITPFLSTALSKLGDDSMWMITTTAFRNEPYR